MVDGVLKLDIESDENNGASGVEQQLEQWKLLVTDPRLSKTLSVADMSMFISKPKSFRLGCIV